VANKIYDIMPPQEDKPIINKNNSEIIKDKNSGVLPVKVVKEEPVVANSALKSSPVLPENNVQSEFVDKSSKKDYFQFIKNKKLPWKFWLGVSFCALLLIVCGYFYFSLQSAYIQVWPKTELLSFQEKVSAESSIKEIDFDNKKIPAEVFEIEKDLWQDFQSTGSAQNASNASGTITIYNKLNPATSFTLISGTHFLSDSGKYFLTQEKVTIPAGTMKSGKIIPGSINVKVIAKEPGKDSNIEASKFSIPKLVGTNYYYSIYAESTNPMSGGILADVKKVTDFDLSNAKKELSEKVLLQAESELRKKISPDYVLFDNAITKNVTETFASVKSGALVDNFNYQVKVKAKAIAFKREYIESFSKKYINLSSNNQNILQSSFTLDFNPESVNINSGNLAMDVKSSCKIYNPIDQDDLLDLFKQKNATEIKDILFNRLPNQIEKLDIKFWPFWTKKAPNNIEKIDLKLKFN